MKLWWWCVVGVGLAARLAVAWRPVSTLVAHTLPDDAFIYFVIARNLASGLGATFDGLRPTNGFHPLWAMTIAPMFLAAPGGDWPVHAVLTVEALCDVLAGMLAARVVAVAQNQPVTQSRASLLTLALYLFNPRAVQESVNGLETGAAMLALAACAAVWIVWLRDPGSYGRAAAFGALAGVLVLARSDLGLIVPLLVLPLLIQKHWRPVALAGITALAVAAPWFVWSQWRVGSIVQSSAVAIPSLVAHRIQISTDPVELWNQVLFPIVNYSFRYTLIYPGLAVLAGLVSLVLLRLARLRRQAADVQWDWRWLLPLVGSLLIVLVHTFVRWYPRGWYFAPLAWSGALVAGPLLAAALTTGPGRRYGWAIVLLLGLVAAAQSVKMIAEPEYRWQVDMRAGADWLRQNTGQADVVGAFNAGIYAYYGERRVLSLDGLVDWEAIEARQRGRLLGYFQDRGGTLLIDHEAYVMSFSPFFGPGELDPLVELPVADEAYGPIIVYRVH